MATITEIMEDYVSFKTAKLLKEKGFDVNTVNFWHIVPSETCNLDALEKIAYGDVNEPEYSENYYPMITLQMAMKWLREVHKLYVDVYMVKNYNNKTIEYCITIEDLNFPGSDDGIDISPSHESYETACEAAIKYCLEKLI